jgi:hypothetical protein
VEASFASHIHVHEALLWIQPDADRAELDRAAP